MGSRKTCTFLGVIQKVPDDIGKKRKRQSGQLSLSLGERGIKYEITKPSLGDRKPLEQFLAICRSQEESLFRHEVTDNVSVDIFARAWSTALTTIAKACPNMHMTNPDNDCHEFVMRKAIIGEVCRPGAAVDWKSVSWKQLKKWCPDKKTISVTCQTCEARNCQSCCWAARIVRCWSACGHACLERSKSRGTRSGKHSRRWTWPMKSLSIRRSMGCRRI